MRRGEVWTVAGGTDHGGTDHAGTDHAGTDHAGTDHAGTPRPVVVVRDDRFDATDSITICAFTTDETDTPLFRLRVQPNERKGLRAACRLMVDEITTVPKTKLRARRPAG